MEIEERSGGNDQAVIVAGQRGVFSVGSEIDLVKVAELFGCRRLGGVFLGVGLHPGGGALPYKRLTDERSKEC